jgi:hypothetical protein
MLVLPKNVDEAGSSTIVAVAGAVTWRAAAETSIEKVEEAVSSAWTLSGRRAAKSAITPASSKPLFTISLL